MSRKTSPLLIALLLVAWALLTIRIGAQWFGHQEANGAWFSVATRNWQVHGFWQLGGIIDTNPDLLGAMEPYTHHPPLAVWLAAFPALLTGYSEALLRFVMASCTLIGIAALYALARRLGGRSFALWSAAAYAFTPMLAYFGRMPDHEAPALMFSLLFALWLVEWLRRPSRAKWWGMVALTVAVTWTAWGGLIVVGLLSIAALFYTKRRIAVIMLGVVALGALIALLGYYVYFFNDAIPDLINAFVWRTSTSSVELGSVAFTWGEYGLRLLVRLITLYSPTVFLLALIGVGLVLPRAGLRRGIVIALVIAGFGYMLLFRNASFIHDYYLIYTAPGIALLAGAAPSLLPRRRSRWLSPVIAGLILFTLPATLFYLRELYAGSDDVTGSSFAQFIHDRTTPQDLILSNAPTVGYSIEFYAERRIGWGTSPERAQTIAEGTNRAVYYAYCGDDSPPVTPLSDVAINPACRLICLR